RVLLLDEVGDLRQYLSAGPKVAGARHRQVERGPSSGSISYIVNQQSHLKCIVSAPDASRMTIVEVTLERCRPASIRSDCSSPTRGRRTTTMGECSSISRRPGPFIISTPASRRRNGRSTKNR